MNTIKEKKGLNISAKSFITAIVIIFILMVLTYVLTFLVPGGEYTRIIDANGNLVIDVTGEFALVAGGISFWKWLLSPILVLGAEGNGSLIAVIIFLLVLGGVFNSLDQCGLMRYLLQRITFRFGASKYRLMACVTLFFMAMGSFIGSFEECVPLVPIVVALAVGLGWDALTGVGMSLLAAGCGFAAGICNPFTVGVAQELAGLPMFSGMWFRVIGFGLIYGLLLVFLFRYAKRIDKTGQEQGQVDGLGAHKPKNIIFVADRQMDKGVFFFAAIVGLGIVFVLSSVFVTVLQDYTMIIVAVMFLVAGITAVSISGTKARTLGSTFWNGLVSVLPAVLMILMANSIKYTMTEAHILDTILHSAVTAAAVLPKWAVILFIYLLVLVMNFFIPSGSAKAFLMIPLIVPVAQVFGISAQLCVLAYAFGDGFSNAFYPTNPVLLISLGLADVNYGTWARWSGKFQILNLMLTGALLLVGLVIGYC
ncbi:MAG: YfcC family protein [Lachnospiraceae bacterium]|nr:YfcC family protein [Lachnospiraceae bacterium]